MLRSAPRSTRRIRTIPTFWRASAVTLWRGNPLMIAVVTALGCWGVYFGVQTWRGKEAAVVEKVQRQGQSGRWIWGGAASTRPFSGLA